jgi:polygalacturonase
MNTPAQYTDVTAPPFNAAGDGKTDDAPAFQRAVDSLSRGGMVKMPRVGRARGEPTNPFADSNSDSDF